MAQLMAKNLGHQDLVWVVPCVGDIEYPTDPDALLSPVSTTILGVEYEVQARVHVLRNITYILLDAPIFRQQTKAEPYPARMDDIASAIYYSAWNQCIAEMIRRYNPDLYHINDYHGALAPLYLLPSTIPCALSLHNAEFQGLWPIRTKKEREEVCNVFNLELETVQRYIQFGEVFNLLHAGASYLRIHQNGFGAVGVSKKYGERSYARYPIFWGLKDIGALPNPDPSDTADWSPEHVNEVLQEIPVDAEFEATRPRLREEAQRWAGLEVKPDADLFVFVGRWSMQKGIDLIADIFPAILEENEHVQLICIGPVIDLYGRFAAIKLGKLMEVFPGRVCSIPSFTQLPACIFSGAEFALIPSRDEPFGLVAVEFGRRGALGVGARVGGLGQMPGWWYTVESMSTKHLLNQFKGAINGALASKQQLRAQLRARSAKQRFPVMQWVQDLEKLHVTAMKKYQKVLNRKSHRLTAPFSSRSSAREGTDSGFQTPATPGTPRRGHSPNRSAHRHDASGNVDLPAASVISPLEDPSARPGLISSASSIMEDIDGDRSGYQTPVAGEQYPELDLERNEHVFAELGAPFDQPAVHSRHVSMLSFDAVVGQRKDYKLQNVDPFFTDAKHEYQQLFEHNIDKLNAKNTYDTVIEEFLVKSEKNWFNRHRAAKLGKRLGMADSKLLARPAPIHSSGGDIQEAITNDALESANLNEAYLKEFSLAEDYKPPTGIKRFMLHKLGDWPLYSIFLALVSPSSMSA